MQESNADGAKRRGFCFWLRRLLLPLILLSMIPLLESGVEDNSPTSDEWSHFIRGVSFWTTGDTKLSYAHPPLANAVAGLPFAWEPSVPDLRSFRAWESGEVRGVYNEYLKADYARARAQLVRGRRFMFVFPLLLVSYVYFFCLSQFGWRTAAAASVLLAYNPNVLAHGSVITTDLAAALGYVVATGEFARYLRGPPSSWRLLGMSVAVGSAILCKHSCILLVPMLGSIGLVAAIRGWGVFSATTGPARAARYLGHIGATAVIAVLVVNAGYRFNDTGMRVDELLAKPEPQYWISKPFKHTLLEQKTPLEALPSSLPIPLPYTQVFGLTCIGEQNQRGWFRSYFWGRKQPKHGHPLYFPVLLLIKTPLPVFGLATAGLIVAIRSRRKPSIATITIALMLGYFVVMLMRSNLNMGMRHAMPAVPLLTILAARGFELTWDRVTRRAAQVGLVVALACVPAAALLTHPNYFGWFNAAVGSERGHWISIVGEDWNQDLLRASRYVQDHQLAPVYVVDHSEADNYELRWSGLDYRPLDCKQVPKPGSYVIMRAAIAKTSGRKCRRWAVGLAPIHEVNRHMYIYRIPEGADPGSSGAPSR